MMIKLRIWEVLTQGYGRCIGITVYSEDTTHRIMGSRAKMGGRSPAWEWYEREWEYVWSGSDGLDVHLHHSSIQRRSKQDEVDKTKALAYVCKSPVDYEPCNSGSH
jgi:hypothetical protein